MKVRLLFLFALVSACSPEPKETPESSSTSQPEETASDGSSDQTSPTTSDTTPRDPVGTSSSDTGASTSEPPAGAAGSALTPELWSGRRLRGVYRAGDDGSISVWPRVFWDLELNAFCELHNSLMGGFHDAIRPGDRWFCFPFVGSRPRCTKHYGDPECSQEIEFVEVGFDESYKDLYYIHDERIPSQNCVDLHAGLYRIDKLDEQELRGYYEINNLGRCMFQESPGSLHKIELGARVSMDILVSGTIEID